MSPEHRAAIRQGVNLATLPEEVRNEIAGERIMAMTRSVEVKRRAAELFEIRNQRMRVDRALHEMGDLGAAVRAELNKLIERRKR